MVNGTREAGIPPGAREGSQAAGTIRGVIADLSPLPERLYSGADPGMTACLLEQLSRELVQAAGMLRAGERA